MFVENNNLVIGTTTDLYILDSQTGLQKNRKTFDKEANYFASLDEGILVAYWENLPNNSSYVFEYYDYNCKRLWKEEIETEFASQYLALIQTKGLHFVYQRVERGEDKELMDYGAYVYNSKGVLQTQIIYDYSTHDFYTKGWFYYLDIMPSLDNSVYFIMKNDTAENPYTLNKYTYTEVKGIDGFSFISSIFSGIIVVIMVKKIKRKGIRGD
ncbi:MAG: hypothetical protein HGN29_03105 [Asgard group archaeon]|nr:hypothetical protein [Asgard group archaeon]